MNKSKTQKQDWRMWIASRTAKPMFWLSTIFLVGIACLIVIWVDVPNLHESASAGDSLDDPTTSLPGTLERFVVGLLLITWPIFILESVFHWLTRPWDSEHRKYHWFGLLNCFCPALRMCARLPEMGERVWLPGIGWRRPDKRLRRRLEHKFSVPMIAIALMIMPILVIEFFFKSQVAQYQSLRTMMHIGTGVIWFAFAAEFILMVSVADKKLAYCKKHWVDLVIILLPLFSFLRSLRALRATRVAKLMRVPQIGKLARVYRLRGTAIKAVQAMILLDVVQRWLTRSPEKTIKKLKQQLLDIEDEAKHLQRKITRLQRQIDQKKSDDTNQPNDADQSKLRLDNEEAGLSSVSKRPCLSSTVASAQKAHADSQSEAE